MSKISYVLAKDSDFREDTFGNSNGSIIYIGTEPYIEIPHVIQGEKVTNINWMFYANKIIRGVKSTNVNLISMRGTFCACNLDELDLSELDVRAVVNLNKAFYRSMIKHIVFPKTGFSKLKNVEMIFAEYKGDELDLSAFDFSKCKGRGIINHLKVNKIILPSKGLKLLFTCEEDLCYPLKGISVNSQTEEICWIAVLANKGNGKYVRIKSKKILMYLGDECPEYVKFYYGKESI